MNTIPADVKQLLDQHDWDDTIPRLIKYAVTKIRRLSWYQEQGGQVAAGKMAEDFVMDAIVKIYQGQRQWDPETMPDLLIYLFGVLRSEINHHSHSLENRCLHFLDALSDRRQKDAQTADTDKMPDGFMEGFLAEIKDAPRLAEVAALLAAGRKPAAIAQELNIDVNEIYNLRKVLKRRLENYLTRLKEIT
ncbi:MAG: hypothetical protein K8I00_04985 [Candidatus Omnitrophica bacterium]|nr:hypothetical protein [Candidatus Omnitrophota bacterium]